MKNPARVAELINQLKAECEFTFEFAAVDVLAEAISKPLVVNVIDDRHQEFCGKKYHKRKDDGHFYGCGGKTLHREVWKSFWGKIPAGFVIHHVDENKNNNNIENLQLVSRAEHARIHNSDICRFPKRKFICQMCGKEYEATDNGKNKFCSQSCTQKNYAQSHPITKTCPYCGKEFSTRHKKTKYCSSTCASRAYRQNLS